MRREKTKRRTGIVRGVFSLGLLMVLFSFPAHAMELAKGWEFNGFLRNNTGFFTGNQDFTNNSNQLATERNWLRVKVDGQILPSLGVMLVGQGIFEPEYEIEDGSTVRFGEYNEADLREAYMTWKPWDEHKIMLGRQIVTWGESLGFRVGDVINPQDSRFAFSFANLEDTRIPQWMARGVHQLPAASSSFEWIVNPLWTEATDRVDPLFAQPTSATVSVDGKTFTPGWRFAIYPETRLRVPYSTTSVVAPGSLMVPPIARAFSYYTPPALWGGFVPLPADYWPTEIPFVRYEHPNGDHTFKDLRFGGRTSTTIAGYQFGFFYWHTQEYTPVIERGDIIGETDLGKALAGDPFRSFVVPNREYIIHYPEVNILGAYINKDMPLGVLRSEVTYRPRRTYNTLDPAEPTALVKRDNLQYLLAWDIQTMFRPLSETGTVDINLEYYGNWVIGDSKYLNVPGYLTPIRRDDHSFLFNIGTGFDYDKYHVGVTLIHNVQNNGAVMPSVKYVPDAFNKACSFELKYIGVYGRNDFEGLGLYRQKSMVVLTSQFSW